ncbi:YjcQ protein [compost metagenome]
MEPRDFVKIAQIIKDEGYLKNVAIAATIVWYNHAEITMKGIKYLEENSLLSKTYKGLKELRAWLK